MRVLTLGGGGMRAIFQLPVLEATHGPPRLTAPSRAQLWRSASSRPAAANTPLMAPALMPRIRS